MTHLTVRGLTPREWLNRCSSVWPEYAAQAYEGLTDDDGRLLLQQLSERFEAFDEYIGHCPIVLDPSFVGTTRTLLGSLKKFRDSVGVNERELETAALNRFELNNEAARAGQIPRRFIPGMQRFLKVVLSDYPKGTLPLPHFGPGAVAERLSIPDRWIRITSNGEYNFSDPDDMSCWACGAQAPTCRLSAVPKDWNKKRLITVEPYRQSYLQHYTRELLWRTLSRSKVAGLRALATPDRVDPQARHRALARRGSMDGTLATLDMSDASDLVSFSQVATVFPANVMADLERSRSTMYQREREAPRPLYMYGGMGNATTFTVETLVFHAACYAIADYHRLSYNDSFVSCYGDDMVVSERLATLITDLGLFEEFGWKLNKNKSYWHPMSRFRESCGGQYYTGHDVTLLRYQGGYTGIYGLIAYRELIMRIARNPRWRKLTWNPWTEQNMPNSTSTVTDGALITSVPWWPDTLVAPARKNLRTQEKELLLPVVTLSRRVHPKTGLGLVYGSLAGQLARQTGTRRIHGRKVHGVLVPVPRRASIRSRWVAIGELDVGHPRFGSVPGLMTEVTDDALLLKMLARAGRS